MEIILISAVAENGVIGHKNTLPWSLPNDLKQFKELTKGHTLIMGRRTFESVGGRPLPNRKHVIVTTMQEILSEHPDVEFSYSVNNALSIARNSGAEKVFIAGGARIYKEALPFVTKVYLTRVFAEPVGDTKFPEVNFEDKGTWENVSEIHHTTDEKHVYPYAFIEYRRK